MSSEAEFRLALVLVFGLTMGVGIYHRAKAHTPEKFDRRQEGLALAIALRLAGFATWIAILLYLINPAWMEWAHVDLPAWLRWTGAALGIASFFLAWWTFANLGKNLTDTVATRADATIVTTGPYRFVRHPFYVAAFLLLTAASLLTANWFIAACGLAAVAMLALRTPKEEQKLVEKFGDQYRSYMATTGRFWPKL